MIPFKEILLTKEERKILRKIRLHQPVKDSDTVSRLATEFCFVIRHYDRVTDPKTGLRHPVPNGKFSLTPEYERYRIYRREQYFVGKLPVILSIIALIISSTVAIFEVMQAIKQ